MLHVIIALNLATAIRFGKSLPHALGNFIAVKNDEPVHVPGRATDGLNQRALATQEAFFISIQNRHERDFRQIETFSKKVNPHQNVKGAESKITKDLDSLERLNVRVQVLHSNPLLLVIASQFLGELLRQNRHQHAVTLGDTFANFGQQVIDLSRCASHFDNRIDEARRTNDLLSHLSARFLQLVFARSCRNVDGLVQAAFPLFKVQRTVIERGRKAEPVIHKVHLSSAVASVHAPDLRNRDVTLVDDKKPILREVLEQSRRRITGRAPRQMARIVLNALAKTKLFDHLKIEHRSLLQALSLKKLPGLFHFLKRFAQLHSNGFDRALAVVDRRHVMASRIDRHTRELVQANPSKGVDLANRFDFVAEEFNTDRALFFVSRKDLDHVATYAERPTVKIDVVSLVLNFNELAQHFLPLYFSTDF